MNLKTVLFAAFVAILAIFVSTFVLGGYFVTQAANVPTPFHTIDNVPDDENITDNGIVGVGDVGFVNRDLQTGWMPWIIKQISILVGAISLIVFFYAGVKLVVQGDNEEEFGKAIKTLIYGVVGIALAAFSYTIIANLLAVF